MTWDLTWNLRIIKVWYRKEQETERGVKASEALQCMIFACSAGPQLEGGWAPYCSHMIAQVQPLPPCLPETDANEVWICREIQKILLVLVWDLGTCWRICMSEVPASIHNPDGHTQIKEEILWYCRVAVLGLQVIWIPLSASVPIWVYQRKRRKEKISLYLLNSYSISSSIFTVLI